MGIESVTIQDPTKVLINQQIVSLISQGRSFNEVKMSIIREYGAGALDKYFKKMTKLNGEEIDMLYAKFVDESVKMIQAVMNRLAADNINVEEAKRIISEKFAYGMEYIETQKVGKIDYFEIMYVDLYRKYFKEQHK